MPLLPGSRLGPYEVVSPIGAGGMGEVYKARDTKLDRDVALKILPESFADDPDRMMRFEREAKTLASLNHPNIALVYGLEQQALVLEYIDGEDLSARIARGPIPFDDALRIATQIAEALEAAHAKGIVHRDLKPANVMVTGDGRVKVLDFGLATRVGGDLGASRTKLGTEMGVVLGTIPYMSPEQVQGLPLDRGTDIFSLGILMHEMVCGARPFGGDTAAALMSAILRDDPPAASAGQARLPEALDDLIRHCLEKRPADRPTSAAAVGQRLKRIASGLSAVTPERLRVGKTVVVLPFANRSGDPDNEYFSDGQQDGKVSHQLHWNDVNTNRATAADGLGRADEFAARALALDRNLPLAISVRGLVAGLRDHLYRAHALAPNDANILAELCRFSNVAGLQHHGVLVDRVGELDPLTPLTPLVFSCYHWLQGRHDRLVPFARRAVGMASVPSMLQIIAGWQMDAAGERTEASGILRATGEALAGSVLGSWASFHERALAGDEAGALAHGAGLESALRNEFAAIMMAEACALLARRNDALRWVRTAVQFGFVNYPFLSEHSRYLEVLRADREFQDVLRDVQGRWQRLIAWEQTREDGRGRLSRV